MPIRGTICSYLFVASGQQNWLDFKAPSRFSQRICFSAALNNFTFQACDISEVVPQLHIDDDVPDRLRIVVS